MNGSERGRHRRSSRSRRKRWDESERGKDVDGGGIRQISSFNEAYASSHDPLRDQLTVRAVVGGAIIGTIMAFANLYFGLQVRWIPSISIYDNNDR